MCDVTMLDAGVMMIDCPADQFELLDLLMAEV